MGFRRFLYILAFLAIFAMAMRVSIASDTFWHLRAGDWILEHGQLLREDPFSLTRQGQDWPYPGWLSQVTMTMVYRAWGYPGLNLFTTFFVLLGFMFLSLAITGRDAVRISVLLLAAVTSSVYWSARPHITTFALTGLFIWVLESYRQGSRNLLWILPVGMALWGNIHGGFASGFIVLFCYLLGELFETVIPVIRGGQKFTESIRSHQTSILQYAGTGLISAAAISLNPHGPRMLLYPFMTVGIESLRDYIQEWQSPNFHESQLYPFLLTVLLLIFAFAASEKRISPHEYVLVSVFLVLALTAARNIALFALISAPVLTRHLSSGLKPILDRIRSKEQFRPEIVRLLNLILLVLCLVAVAVKISTPLRSDENIEILREIYPYEAVDFIQRVEPEGPLFNSYNFGSLILWELYPQYLSFVDGRTDLFNDEILETYLAAWRGEPEWREIFDRWGIRLVFIEPDAPLRTQLELNGWEVIFSDDQAAVLVP